jgi:DNA-binding CsgD family transcriptional regulator
LNILGTLSKSERELLAISTKTDLLTEELLTHPAISKNGPKDFKTILDKNLIQVIKSPEGFQITHNPELSPILHLDFLELPKERRTEVCKLIADEQNSRSDNLSALKTLCDSGDSRLFTDAMLMNTIEIYSTEVANDLIQLSNQMLQGDQREIIASKSFKIVAYIWLGKYIHALDLISEIESDINSGSIEKTWNQPIQLLKAVCNSYMGRVLEGAAGIEEFCTSADENQKVQDAAVIIGCKLYAATGLLVNNQARTSAALRISSKFERSQLSNYYKYLLTQIEAVDLFVSGYLNKAYEKAIIAIDSANIHGFIGYKGPIESLYIKASCEEEFLEIHKAADTWKKLRTLIETSNLPAWKAVLTIREARNKYNLDFKIDLNEAVSRARKIYEDLPYRNEIDIIVDIEEFFVAYRLGNLDRAKYLYRRIPTNPRVDEVALGIAVKETKDLKIKEESNLTPRQEIMQLITMTYNPKLSENKIRHLVERVLEIAEANGFYRLLCLQSPVFGSMVVRIASRGNNAFQEQLARMISDMSENKIALSNEERISLTTREKEILALLAAGYERTDICDQLALSFNTLKTHQKNLYKKLEAKTRDGAISNAKKLGLLAQ